MARRRDEERQQCAFIEWVRLQSHVWPALKTIHHVPNGEYRTPATAARLKRMGVLSGVLDIFWPCARQGYNGLYIEFKSADGSLSEAQEDFAEAAAAEGYCVFICDNWEDARDLVMAWVRNDPLPAVMLSRQ